MFSTAHLINIDLTSNCNQRCNYCCFFERKSESCLTDCDTLFWLTFFADASNSGVFVINLRGGEPLTRTDFRELIQGIVNNRMRFSLQTNGLLLDETMAEFLAKTNRCNKIKISLDGPEELHDIGRGKGTHAKALSAINKIRRFDLPLEVCCAVHKYNYKYLETISKYFFEQLKLTTVSFSAVQKHSCGDKNWYLNDSELYNAFGSLALLERKYGNFMLNSSMISTIRRWQKMLNDSGYQRIKRFGECTGFNKYLSILANGEYVPCPAMANISLGNIAKISIGEAFKNLNKFNTSLSMTTSNKCLRCQFFEQCSGGCPATDKKCGCLSEFIKYEGTQCLSL